MGVVVQLMGISWGLLTSGQNLAGLRLETKERCFFPHLVHDDNTVIFSGFNGQILVALEH